MDVSVAICTWNRASLLDATLAQMCKMRVPPGTQWELLVVDNNCTDHTAAVIESYADRLPIQRLIEPEQGLSKSRNRVLRRAVADLLLFTDDDVLVDEAWFCAYVDAAKRWPDAGFFGGLITPWLEREPPSWFHENWRALSPAMALRDLGDVERELGADEPPFGANMAFRRSAFSSCDFDETLGPNADDQVRGDETTYCRALAARGFQGVWVPSAKVQHYVVADRLTENFVRKYWTGLGRTEVRLGDPHAKRVPRWVYRALVVSHADYLWQRATRSSKWVRSMVRAARARGVWLEYRRLSRLPVKSP
jgi:glycosyltransferase involved in cell wall biosynthesis